MVNCWQVATKYNINVGFVVETIRLERLSFQVCVALITRPTYNLSATLAQQDWRSTPSPFRPSMWLAFSTGSAALSALYGSAYYSCQPTTTTSPLTRSHIILCFTGIIFICLLRSTKSHWTHYSLVWVRSQLMLTRCKCVYAC